MGKRTKVMLTGALLALFSAAAAAAVISINVTGSGGTASDAIDDAVTQGNLECTNQGGLATGAFTIISVQYYPGQWWAELNVYCNVP